MLILSRYWQYILKTVQYNSLRIYKEELLSIDFCYVCDTGGEIYCFYGFVSKDFQTLRELPLPRPFPEK